MTLNASQSAAVEHDRGPLLVLAGAGSGKTRVITHRIARLVERGTRPEAILAVSFTNKAAAEMGERMIPLLGRERASKLWLSTFHSFGVRFLGEEAKHLGYPHRFVIFDQGDALGVVREIVRREGLADRQLDLYAVHARISLWKNQGLVPGDVRVGDFEYDVLANSVYPHYEAGLRSMCAVDFDDLVLAPVRILRAKEDVREKWRNRFRYLLIDEFQDTNKVQLDLVKLLANELGNVCVVGDDDQSIYGWRGAEVGNILDFESHFGGATIVKLEDNYRSRQPILEVANAAIARSSHKRHGKVLRAAKGMGPKVRLCALDDAEQEARFVADEIRVLKREGFQLGGMAVLYRSNLQARPLEEELRAHGIGYRLFGGTQFFDRKEVKDAVAYLRVVVYPRDELSLRRILNYPARGIGDTTIQRLERWALAHDKGLVDALCAIGQLDDVPDGAQRGAQTLLSALGRARAQFATGANLAAAAQQLFVEVGLQDALTAERTPAAQRRWGNVQYVLRSLQKYEEKEKASRPSLGQFLTRITLNVDAETEATGERVTLSSLHAAKGLEFDVVFFIGLNEGTLPHSRTLDPKVTEAAPTDVEEERRLFYVGVTRAKERLYLCRPKRRSMRGKVTAHVPTRFLEGLPEEHYEIYDRALEAPVAAQEAVDIGRALLDQLRSR
ncbi:MAG: UvrD-helicase domain-containing protein [Sandaracinaceae bacterium]|nr:UvrD-helicase domain-containing protein [Sandaracinaceae bacterium]